MVVAPEDVSTGAGPVEPADTHPRRSRTRTTFAAFVATVVLLELAARAVSGPLPEPLVWSTPEMQYKVEQMEDLGAAEIALVGSSVVDAGLDPAAFGRPTYNAALGAGSMRMIADFTRVVVVPRLDPDVVVVGVSARELNRHSDTVDQHERDFLAAPAVREALGTETLVDRLDRVLADLSHLFRYRATLRDPGAWGGTEEWDETATRDDGLYRGFLARPYRGGPEVRRGLAERAVPDFEIGERQVGELRDLIRHLVGDDRRVVLTIGPVTADFLAVFPAGARDHEEFVAVVESLAAEHGAELVLTGTWDPSLMADPVHANAAGAARFTALVRDAVARA